MASVPTRTSLRPTALALALTITCTGLLGAPASANASASTATAPTSTHLADDDWLGIVNAYRAMSGLAPVTENPTWSTQARSHSCYMLRNGISHHQEPGKPGYSLEGHTAGMNGNVAVASRVETTPRQHIELWMSGPFHAIGILRSNLVETGFGLCADPDAARWRSGGTLDVLRGLDGEAAAPTDPILFPGRDATVPLDRFIAETPDPVAMCGWSGEAGLPLIAIMPAGVSTADSQLAGPGGPIETCTLHPGNTGSEPTARSVMQSANAVVIVPRQRLAAGRYTASANSDGGSVTWSFQVDPGAPLWAHAAPTDQSRAPGSGNGSSGRAALTTSPIGGETQFAPVTPYRHADSRRGQVIARLGAGDVVPVPIVDVGADPAVTAVSANFTVAGQAGPGHLTVFDCAATVPDVSTVNYGTLPASNQAVVPLADGALCLSASTDTDVIIDVNGRFQAPAAGTTRFTPTAPARVYDTRQPSVQRLTPGEPRAVPITGVPGGPPAGAAAVAVNLTAVQPADGGWLRAVPCGAAAGGSAEVSNVNFGPGETAANSAVVPLSPDGTLCVEADVAVDLLVDVQGYFSTDRGEPFTALRPLRVLDTRSPDAGVNPVTAGSRLTPNGEATLTVAGHAGVPGDARAVAINVTVVDPPAAGYVSVYPCGHRPEASSVNFGPEHGAVANGAAVALGTDGTLCLTADQPVHVLLDVSGVWR